MFYVLGLAPQLKCSSEVSDVSFWTVAMLWDLYTISDVVEIKKTIA